MQGLSKVFQQTFFQILGKVVSVVSTFIILGILTRNYGQDGTGLFTLVLTYISMFMLAGDFGFNAHVLKSYHGVSAKSHSIWNKLLGTRILWSTVLAILAILLSLVLPFTSDNFFYGVLISSPVIIAASIFVTFNLIFQSRLRFDLSVASQITGTIAALVLFLLLARFFAPIPVMLIPNLLSWVFILAVSLFFLFQVSKNLSPMFDLEFSKKLITSSWPIAATLVLNVIYFRADTFLIAFYRSVSESGVYNVAFSIFQSALVLPSFFMNAYYPLMLKSKNGIKLMAIVLGLLALLGSVLTYLLAPWLINFLTGGGFTGSIQSLRILGLGFPAYFLSSLLMWILISTGRYKTLLVIYTTGLIFNLGLNVIFIPAYSYLAASATTALSEYLILFMLFVSLLL